jgi:hypothetical protein
MTPTWHKHWRRGQAYHESGHAVVAIYLGARVRYVVLREYPHPEPGGACNFTVLRFLQQSREVLISLAGPAAQLKVLPAEMLRDQKIASAFRHGTHGDYFAVRRAFRPERVAGLVREAGLLVNDLWPAVASVAEALRERGRLTGEEVHALYEIGMKRDGQ